MKTYPLGGPCRLTFFDETTGCDAPDCRTIDAVVPGNVELDLMRAGILPDVFFGNNIRLLRPYEWYGWRYAMEIDLPVCSPGERLRLEFDGVDCFADYSLNGVCFAHSENALIPHGFDVTDLYRPGWNLLEVTLHSPLLRAARMQYDAGQWAYCSNHEALRVRKAPSQYGWDIMPRAVTAGIWRNVRAVVLSPNEFTDFYLATLRADRNRATLLCSFQVTTDTPRLEGLSVRLTGWLDGKIGFRDQRPLRFVRSSYTFTVEHPALWWPRGYGDDAAADAAVYTVRAELLRQGKPIAAYETAFGIRTVKLLRDEVCDEYGGEFAFEVNGERIFCRGTNWVPPDAFPSRNADRYESLIGMARDLGCNMLRCWGGGVYEDDAFFELCDRAGIMVWQDFAMACAFYPQDEAFCDTIREEAEAVTRRLRNHPSLVLWCGDNECDGHLYAIAGRDPNENILTRQILPGVLRRTDPQRPYLPSSPYSGKAVLERAARLRKTPETEAWPPMEPYKPLLPEDHPWGARDYFKNSAYAGLRCAFLSEIGYHGCSDPASMKTFLSPDKLWPWQGNDQWLTHAAEMNGPDGPYAYRIKLMADQVYELFGQQPERLEDFVFASQVSQAEADKFFIESSRQRKGACCGILWWNLADGWPQFSDAVVSYDGLKKLAYYYIRQSSRPVLFSFGEPYKWNIRLFASNDTRRALRAVYRVVDGDTRRVCLEGAVDLPANGAVGVDQLRISYAEQKLYLIEWEIGGKRYTNHYLHGHPAYDPNTMKRWVAEIAAFSGQEDFEVKATCLLSPEDAKKA